MTSMHPLIVEAAKKAAVAWLTTPGGGKTYPVWGVWVNEAYHVVTGTGEQETPGLAEASAGSAEVKVTMRGDHGGRIVRWPATVVSVVPESEEWESVAPAVAAKRLNAPMGAEQTTKRWATECAIYRLAPAGDPDQAGQSLPSDAMAETVRPSTGTRLPKSPFRLHRVRKVSL